MLALEVHTVNTRYLCTSLFRFLRARDRRVPLIQVLRAGIKREDERVAEVGGRAGKRGHLQGRGRRHALPLVRENPLTGILIRPPGVRAPAAGIAATVMLTVVGALNVPDMARHEHAHPVHTRRCCGEFSLGLLKSGFLCCDTPGLLRSSLLCLPLCFLYKSNEKQS